MCDCYGHKCECCDEFIPMHIGDFANEREEFKVWCEKHINQAPSGAVIFEVTKAWDEDDEGVGWKCAILGPEVGGEGGNHPNIGGDMSETTIKDPRP